MSILIDPPLWPAHGTLFSHLVSDASLEELHEFARSAQISDRAFDRDHYDVPRERYDALVAAGAREVSATQLVRALVGAGLRIPARFRPEKLDGILTKRWSATVPGQPHLGRQLLDAWSEPHRQYHDRVHLLSVLEAVDWLSGDRLTASDKSIVQLASWFHDAVYDGAPDDEQRSALLAAEKLDGLMSTDHIQAVQQLVLLTMAHDPDPSDRLGKILSDADLEVLARPEPAYRRYAQSIYREYAHLPAPDLALGRIQILQSLLDAGSIYRTPHGIQRWEEAARQNLSAEIRLLKTWL